MGFRLDLCALPCCGARRPLNELAYAMPQGFSRVQMLAMNPGLDRLPDRALLDIGDALGAPVRLLWRQR